MGYEIWVTGYELWVMRNEIWVMVYACLPQAAVIFSPYNINNVSYLISHKSYLITPLLYSYTLILLYSYTLTLLYSYTSFTPYAFYACTEFLSIQYSSTTKSQISCQRIFGSPDKNCCQVFFK